MERGADYVSRASGGCGVDAIGDGGWGGRGWGGGETSCRVSRFVVWVGEGHQRGEACGSLNTEVAGK